MNNSIVSENSVKIFEEHDVYIESKTFIVFTTVRGYARLSGKNPSTISRRLQGVALEKKKELQILTAGGVQGVALVSEELIAEWLPKDNAEMATKFILLGVRKFFHDLVGFTPVQPKETELLEPEHVYENRTKEELREIDRYHHKYHYRYK